MITTLRISIAADYLDSERQISLHACRRGTGRPRPATPVPTGETPVSPPELRRFLCARSLLGHSSHAQTSQFLGYHLARAQNVAIALHNRRGGVEDRFVRALIRRRSPFRSRTPRQRHRR